MPGEIFIMSNRKRLREGGKFVRKTVFWATTFLPSVDRVYIDRCIKATLYSMQPFQG
jgi:hypothetical protein